MAVLAWVLAVLLSGCSASRALCPLEGGRPWVEVKSPHFAVRTNLDEDTAEEASKELETLRQGLLQAWGEGFDPPGTVEVIVLRNRQELAEFTNVRIEGYSATFPDGPVLVMPGNGYAIGEDPTDLGTQAHELTHYLSQFSLVRQPRWLSEGLAMYMETIRFKADKKEVILGTLHGVFGDAYRYGWLTLDELWEWDRKGLLSTAESRRHYSSAWLWVHFFISRHGERFEAFQNRLIRGEEPRRAWEESFRGLKDLDGQLNAYVRGGRHVNYPTITAPLPPVPDSRTLRYLEPAEVHAIRARLFLMTPGAAPHEERLEKAEREMAQALKEDPDNLPVTLLRIRSSADPARRLELARRLVERHAESGLAWDALAQALDSSGYTGEEQEAARQRAVELLPDSVGAQNGLAGYYARTSQPEKGLAAAQRALALAPGNAEVLDTYSTLLFQLGRCQEALAAQQVAVQVLYEGVSDRLRQTVQDTLARYEAVCGGAPPALAPRPAAGSPAMAPAAH
jgi:tetratricopeptide (TPR) repeat protein